MKSLAVRVLGDFGVDGVDPQALGSRKARLALHLLALAEGQAVPSDVLIDALWGDNPPARPEDQLASVARLLRHRAHRALGVPVDLGAVAADLDLLDASVAIEAWRWTGDVAADFAVPGWLDRAADSARRLAQGAGSYAGRLQQEAGRRLEEWRGPGA